MPKDIFCLIKRIPFKRLRASWRMQFYQLMMRTQTGKCTMFVIDSSLGSTDCSGCEIFRKGAVLFAKRIERPGFVTLPIKIAEMPNAAAAKTALKRIQYAIKTGKKSVELKDLEETDILR